MRTPQARQRDGVGQVVSARQMGESHAAQTRHAMVSSSFFQPCLPALPLLLPPPLKAEGFRYYISWQRSLHGHA